MLSFAYNYDTELIKMIVEEITWNESGRPIKINVETKERELSPQ